MVQRRLPSPMAYASVQCTAMGSAVTVLRHQSDLVSWPQGRRARCATGTGAHQATPQPRRMFWSTLRRTHYQRCRVKQTVAKRSRIGSGYEPPGGFEPPGP